MAKNIQNTKIEEAADLIDFDTKQIFEAIKAGVVTYTQFEDYIVDVRTVGEDSMMWYNTSNCNKVKFPPS